MAVGRCFRNLPLFLKRQSLSRMIIFNVEMFLQRRNCGPRCVAHFSMVGGRRIYHGGIVDLDVLHIFLWQVAAEFTMEELWTWMCCTFFYGRWPQNLPWRNCGPGCVACSNSLGSKIYHGGIVDLDDVACSNSLGSKIYHGGIVDLDVLHVQILQDPKFTMEELWTWMCCMFKFFRMCCKIYHGGIVDLDVLHQNLPWRNCGPGCVACSNSLGSKIYHGGIVDLDVLHQNLPWRNCGPGCVASKFTMEELWTWMCCIKIYHGGIVDLDVLHQNLPWRNCGPGCVASKFTMEELWTWMCCTFFYGRWPQNLPWRNCGPGCVAHFSMVGGRRIYHGGIVDLDVLHIFLWQVAAEFTMEELWTPMCCMFKFFRIQNLPWRNCGPGCVASKSLVGGLKFTMEELWTPMCCIVDFFRRNWCVKQDSNKVSIGYCSKSVPKSRGGAIDKNKR